MGDSVRDGFFVLAPENPDEIYNGSAGLIISVAKKYSLGGLGFTSKMPLVDAWCKKPKKLKLTHDTWPNFPPVPGRAPILMQQTIVCTTVPDIL